MLQKHINRNTQTTNYELQTNNVKYLYILFILLYKNTYNQKEQTGTQVTTNFGIRNELLNSFVCFCTYYRFTQPTNFLKKKIRECSVHKAINQIKRRRHTRWNTTKKLKISRLQWKSVKRVLHRNKLKLLTTYRNTTPIQLTKHKKVTISKKIKSKSFKKRLSRFYTTRRRLNMAALRIRYNNWLKNNKKKFLHSRIYNNTNTHARLNATNNILLFLARFSNKRQVTTILRKKIVNRTNHKLRIFRIKTTKTNNLRSQKSIIPKMTSANLHTQTNTAAHLKTPITVNIYKYTLGVYNSITPLKPNYTIVKNYFKKRVKLNNTNTNLLSTKQNLKNTVFNTLFNTAFRVSHNSNYTPLYYLSDIPQLLLKTFSITRKNSNNHDDVDMYFDTIENSQPQIKNIYTTKIKNNNKHNNVNNYFPLYLYNTTQKNQYSNQLTYVKTQSYYYNINVLATTKYKTFFIFFVVNFLENFLKKKIWVRINSKDPIDTFWKNYIIFFLQKYGYLFKRFNKLISVRELLEILWITFKSHDLVILLNFLKKKIENVHFKKHKKILSIFFDVLRKNEYLFQILHIKGFFFDIRGKVGVSGNAKKRHHSLSIGKITTTSQNLGSYFQQISVWTPTGQMGITCIIQY